MESALTIVINSIMRKRGYDLREEIALKARPTVTCQVYEKKGRLPLVVYGRVMKGLTKDRFVRAIERARAKVPDCEMFFVTSYSLMKSGEYKGESFHTLVEKFTESNNIRGIEIFLDEELAFDITQSTYVPLHEKVDDEVAYFLKQTYQRMPMILESGPVARFYRLRRGEVVKITRDDTVTYRQVIRDSTASDPLSEKATKPYLLKLSPSNGFDLDRQIYSKEHGVRIYKNILSPLDRKAHLDQAWLDANHVMRLTLPKSKKKQQDLLTNEKGLDYPSAFVPFLKNEFSSNVKIETIRNKNIDEKASDERRAYIVIGGEALTQEISMGENKHVVVKEGEMFVIPAGASFSMTMDLKLRGRTLPGSLAAWLHRECESLNLKEEKYARGLTDQDAVRSKLIGLERREEGVHALDVVRRLSFNDHHLYNACLVFDEKTSMKDLPLLVDVQTRGQMLDDSIEPMVCTTLRGALRNYIVTLDMASCIPHTPSGFVCVFLGVKDDARMIFESMITRREPIQPQIKKLGMHKMVSASLSDDPFFHMDEHQRLHLQPKKRREFEIAIRPLMHYGLEEFGGDLARDLSYLRLCDRIKREQMLSSRLKPFLGKEIDSETEFELSIKKCVFGRTK